MIDMDLVCAWVHGSGSGEEEEKGGGEGRRKERGKDRRI